MNADVGLHVVQVEGYVTELADKLFFKIGDVAEMVGVKPHVLRYWESEFPSLRPMKTRGSHRMYSRSDLEAAMVIRRLLHEEGYTIPGAKKRIRDLIRARKHGRPEEIQVEVSREVAVTAELVELRDLLRDTLVLMDEPVEEIESHLRVEKVIEAPALIPRR